MKIFSNNKIKCKKKKIKLTMNDGNVLQKKNFLWTLTMWDQWWYLYKSGGVCDTIFFKQNKKKIFSQKKYTEKMCAIFLVEQR